MLATSPLRGDAVGAHHHAADASGFQEMSRHVVGDEGGGDVVLLQFPNGETCALQERAGLIGEDIHFLAGFDGRADHTQRGAVTGGGQRAGIAVREHRFAVGYQVGSVAPDGLVDGDILQPDLLGFRGQSLADFRERPAAQGLVELPHAVDGPEQVDGGRAGARQRFADAIHLRVEIASIGLRHAQRHSHGGRHADGRRAANHHAADGRGDIFISPAGDVFFVQWQARLIDHDYASGGPFDGFQHFC